MAGGGGLAQQVAEKLADLIQVSSMYNMMVIMWPIIHQASPWQEYRPHVTNRMSRAGLFQLYHVNVYFRVKFIPVAVEKALLEAPEVGGWLGVR